MDLVLIQLYNADDDTGTCIISASVPSKDDEPFGHSCKYVERRNTDKRGYYYWELVLEKSFEIWSHKDRPEINAIRFFDTENNRTDLGGYKFSNLHAHLVMDGKVIMRADWEVKGDTGIRNVIINWIMNI